jgi:hypothetical protein
MACLPDETLIAYNEDSLGAIEASQTRDHLLVCPDCRRSAAVFRALDSILATPSLHTPPARLVPQVMQKLFPAAVRYPPVVAAIAASLVFLVTWIYIYFDFSRSSLIQALQLTADGTSGWLANIVKAISAVYNASQAGYKAGMALFNILLPARLSPALVAGALLLLFGGLFFFILLAPRLKKARERKS